MPAVVIVSLCDGKEAEVTVHAAESDVLTVLHPQIFADGGVQGVCCLIVHQVGDAVFRSDAAHLLVVAEDVNHHRYSSLQTAVISCAWALWMVRRPGMRCLHISSRSVTM